MNLKPLTFADHKSYIYEEITWKVLRNKSHDRMTVVMYILIVASINLQLLFSANKTDLQTIHGKTNILCSNHML